jgi:hypothetical protein
MTKATFEKEIQEAVPKLLAMARELSWNKISGNCKFILTEIIDSNENFHVQRNLRKKENNKKNPLAFAEIIPAVQSLYDNLYDINLHIYRADSELTVIDIRYYLKSSLEHDFRQRIIDNPPMLHCKIVQPPWGASKKQKFNINWEHRRWLISWKLFLVRSKINKQEWLTRL